MDLKGNNLLGNEANLYLFERKVLDFEQSEFMVDKYEYICESLSIFYEEYDDKQIELFTSRCFNKIIE